MKNNYIIKNKNVQLLLSIIVFSIFAPGFSAISIRGLPSVPLASAEAQNYGSGLTDYNWVDISSTGISLSLNDDDSTPLFLPFDFPFYNDSFGVLFLSSNGYISFKDATPTVFNEVSPFPSSDPDAELVIAVFWDNLVGTSGASKMYAENRTDSVIIMFEQAKHSGGNFIGTFEVILYNNGNIVMQYHNIDNIYSHTVGINFNGTVGQEYTGLTTSSDEFAIIFRRSAITAAIIERKDNSSFEYNSSGFEILEWWIIDDEYNGSAVWEVFVNDVSNATGSYDPYDSATCSLDGWAMGVYNITLKFNDGLGNITVWQTSATIENKAPRITASASEVVFQPFPSTQESLMWVVTDYYNENFTSSIKLDSQPYSVGLNETKIAWYSSGFNTTAYSGNFTDGPHVFRLTVGDNMTGGEEVNSNDITVIQIWNYAPEISHPADVSYTVNATGWTIDWFVSDFNNTASRSYTVYQNGSVLTSGTWKNNDIISVNIDGLSIGTHEINITVNDGLGTYYVPGGLTANDSVLVTVKPSFLTDNPDFQEPQDLPPQAPKKNEGWPIEYWIYIGIGAAAAAAVVGVVMWKKKKSEF